MDNNQLLQGRVDNNSGFEDITSPLSCIEDEAWIGDITPHDLHLQRGLNLN